ncbi:MAG: hypothetical protein OWU32_12145 [Firmicutes bacterium]|nr:hypothetical protein [Bacillota bacterium]
MGLWVWLVQLVALLVIWKVVHLLFWNMRKMLASSSLLLTMVITLLIGVAGVVFAHTWHGAWSQVLVLAVILGCASGEYEYNRTVTRSS